MTVFRARRLRGLIFTVIPVALLLASYASPVAAGGATRLVDDDGGASAASCDGRGPAHTSIRAALNVATNFDTILVCPGTYVGALDLGELRGVDLVARGTKPAVILAPTRPIQWLVRLGGGSPGDPGNTITGFTLKARGGSTNCGRVEFMIAGAGGAGLKANDNIITVQGSPTWGPCGYGTGIYLLSDSDGMIHGNTVRNWRTSAITTGYVVTVFDNDLHFAHAAGTDCTGGIGGVPYCGGTTAIKVSDYFVGAVVLNTITPGTSLTPGGYLGAGIHVTAYSEESYVLNNTVERAATSLRLQVSEGMQIEVGSNVLRYGSYGLRVTGTDAGDDLDIHDNVSTQHSLWDCYTANLLGQAWVGNIGIKDSPESLCRDR